MVAEPKLVAHHRGAPPRRRGDNRLRMTAGACRSGGPARRHLTHALAALLNGGVQQVEKPRMVCGSTTLCEASAIAVKSGHPPAEAISGSSLCVSEAQTNFSLSASVARIAACHAVPGFDGVAGFQDIEAVVQVIGQQRLQRLDDVLL